LASWNIEVWPEYDKPSVLVIYTGTVADGAAFPQKMRIPVPAGVTLNAVATADATGALISIPWTAETTDAGQEVVFDVDKPQFVVEYYADVLSPPPSRGFDLTLLSPYAAQQGSISLRQPARATEMQITPPLAQTGTDSLGNPLYSQQLGALAAGQAIPLKVAYTKPDATPSVSPAMETAGAGEQLQENGAQGKGTPDWLPWLVGGLIFVLVAALVVYLLLQWQQRRAARSRQARRREARERGDPPPRKPSADTGETGGQNAFCPKCGRKYEQGDRFCRSCGTERR
jgi:hypothetical protein